MRAGHLHCASREAGRPMMRSLSVPSHPLPAAARRSQSLAILPVRRTLQVRGERA